MQIKMRVQMSGARNGEPWPGRGQVVEVPDTEGADLCTAGLAEPVAEPDGPVETATAPAQETRDEGLTKASGPPPAARKASPRAKG